MRKLTLTALTVLVLLPGLVACEEYDSLDEALQEIPSNSDSINQSGWLYTNSSVGFVTSFPRGWSVALEEGDDKNKKMVFHNGKGADFILRFKHMPGKGPKDFLAEVVQELPDCASECCLYPTMPENYLHEKTNEPGWSCNNTIFDAKSRTLIDQHIVVIMHGEWAFAFIAQATTHVDNKVWNNAAVDFGSILNSFSFDVPTPTPVFCPTHTPTPGG